MTAPLQIVLVNPEIPQNTGNVGRTCVGLGIPLHLVGQLGFSLDDRHLKRAGLDYWPKLKLNLHADWTAFSRALPDGADLAFFSTRGAVPLWSRPFHAPCFLVFGSESRGFPPAFYDEFAARLVRIPVGPEIRSLNLATAAGVAAFHAARVLNVPAAR